MYGYYEQHSYGVSISKAPEYTGDKITAIMTLTQRAVKPRPSGRGYKARWVKKLPTFIG